MDHAPEVPIRLDLADAIDRAWVRLSRPGTWWTGVERVEIGIEARAARTCTLCQERGRAGDLAGVEQEHAAKTVLPTAAIDVIHRIVNRPARQSQESYEQALARGLTDAQYVEIVGTVVTVVGIDSFHRAVGLPVKEMPAPVAGEPSRRRPTRARFDRAWVPMVAPSDVDTHDADLYSNDRDGYVIRAMSLVPDEVRGSVDLSKHLYIENLGDLLTGRSLSRPQIELVASRVSAVNECFY